MGADVYLLDHDSKTAVGGYKKRWLHGQLVQGHVPECPPPDDVWCGMTHAQLAQLIAYTGAHPPEAARVFQWAAERPGPFYVASDYGHLPWEGGESLTGEHVPAEDGWTVLDLDEKE